MIRYVYGLCDPRSQQLRYIGVSNNIQKRLNTHLERLDNSHKSHWIRGLIRQKLKPEIFVIEETNELSWKESERFWITYFRYIGADLTNVSDGGWGGTGTHAPRLWARGKPAWNRGIKFTEEQRKNMRHPHSRGHVPWNKGIKYEIPSLKGRVVWNRGRKITEPERVVLTKALRGRKFSEEARANISKGKIKFYAERRAALNGNSQISIANKK